MGRMNKPFVIEQACLEDLPGLIQVLAEDAIGGKGDRWEPDLAPGYADAFAEISADPRARILVARQDGTVVGFVHLYFLRALPSFGRRKVVLNSVFVAAATRGQGVGARLVAAAEQIGREGGATEVTLTSNKKRLDAHRFYRQLGYEQRHEGFSKAL
jgi:GNAT superfamily N-acetyltransferase